MYADEKLATTVSFFFKTAQGNRQVVGNNRLIETGYSAAAPNTPAYTFRGGSQTFFTDTSLNSRWRAQVGVRYIFD